LAALALALALAALAGCGGDDDRAGTTADATGTQPVPTGDGGGDVRLQKIGDFDQPLYVTQPPGNDALYVVEREGTVRLLLDGRVEPKPALDISGKVAVESEQGLLSIAFPPDFESSRLVYAYFTGNDGDQNVVEYQVADDGSFNADTEREVLKMDDFASNHNGGLLTFGPDGLLYIGTGDGGIGDDVNRTAQDLGSPLGKLVRIAPRQSGGNPSSIPAANPFAGEQGARSEIYSYGLRNPWRYSFDRDTGALSIGDVGQNSLEEIDYVGKGQGRGANFGWSAFEGTERFNSDQHAPGAIPPVLTYGRDEGCSVTGGYVVRDPDLPALAGRYLYGDFCAGQLRSFVPSKGGARDDREVGLRVPNLSSFGQDERGRIYATSLDGPVFRLVP
jgi:glucose/arabinose dehydrogenase